MKLFTRISFILSLIITFYCDYCIYNSADPLSNVFLEIFAILFISGLIFMICVMLYVLLFLLIFGSDTENPFLIIEEDIKLIYKQTKLIIKFYLNL